MRLKFYIFSSGCFNVIWEKFIVFILCSLFVFSFYSKMFFPAQFWNSNKTICCYYYHINTSVAKLNKPHNKKKTE